MNLEQLNAMTDLEIDEAVALVHGWDEVPHGRDEKVWDTGIGDFIYNYHPTQDTTEGKAQAFDLMVKYKLGVYLDDDRVTTAYNTEDVVFSINKSPQRAICEAAIRSAQEK